MHERWHDGMMQQEERARGKEKKKRMIASTTTTTTPCIPQVTWAFLLVILVVGVEYGCNAFQFQATTAYSVVQRRQPIGVVSPSPPRNDAVSRTRFAVRLPSSSRSKLHARNNKGFYDDDDEYYDDDYDEYEYERRRRRRQQPDVDDLGEFTENRGLDLPSAFGRRDGWRLPEAVSKALLAGVFILGVGLGVTVDSQVNTNPKDLASRDAIDQAAPNPTLCAKLGASAMAFDERVFVTFNPFNIYVSQADVKPACVLRDSNVVSVLRTRGLINEDEVRACKNNMNTWAFVGSLEETPQLSCVYKSKDAQNEFLSNPKLGIGEDYLDDDREQLEKVAKATGKIVKGGMTDAQKELLRKQAAAVPGLN